MSKRTAPKGGRKRAPAKVRVGDLRVTPGCAKAVAQYAKAHDLATKAVIEEVAEGWWEQKQRKRERERRKAGGKPRG